ncbi:MAG: FtsX-like permease family protein [Deltaproteobacteria bacterium]|nr:FtsX-like permease family protein [Deltaproteobacteria bacterium]
MRTWLARQRSLLDFALGSLWRRKGKNLALTAVYALTVAAVASVLFFTGALRAEAARVLAGSPEVVVQRMVAGRHDLLPAGHLQALRGIRGVGEIRGRLWGYFHDPTPQANYTIQVPDRFWGEEGQAVVGQGVARARRLAPGSPLDLVAHDGSTLRLRVRELLASGSELVSADLVLISEADFRRLFGVPPGVYTDAVLTVRNPREVSTVAAKVAAALPDTRPITREELARTYESIFDWRAGLSVIVLGAAVLAFVVVAWDKASGLSAEERREIGVLKAVGWETSDVLALKAWEGAAVSLTAFGAGVLAAYAHVFLLGAPIFRPALQGWSVLYPQFRLVPEVGPYQLATLFFLSVAPYTAATVVPSWRAATVDPDAVMRS